MADRLLSVRRVLARRKSASRYASTVLIKKVRHIWRKIFRKSYPTMSVGVDFGWLPEEYHLSHEFCFFVHDQLVETLKSGEDANIFHITIDFKSESQLAEAKDLVGEEFILWMESNEMKYEVLYLYYKQLTAALLSDFLHFTYEALRCSAKGKLTVAYSLLRKPFKENLFYFEWLLADPGGFLTEFDEGNIKEISLSARLSPERRKEIIQKALLETSLSDWVDAGSLYDLRYDKNSEHGFERMWQKATHLITTQGSLKTERANLNFVFSGDEERFLQWDHLYQSLPLLLYHALQVIEALLATFAKRQDHEDDLIPFRTQIGFLLWSQSLAAEGYFSHPIRDLAEEFAQTEIDCQYCLEPQTIVPSDIKWFWKAGSIICTNCGSENMYQ